MEENKSKAGLIVIIFAVVAIAVFGGIYLTRNLGKSEKTISKEQADGEMYIDLIMIAKYYERIGDHATNIAEWVLYYLTGNKVSGNKDS